MQLGTFKLDSHLKNVSLCRYVSQKIQNIYFCICDILRNLSNDKFDHTLKQEQLLFEKKIAFLSNFYLAQLPKPLII